MLDVARSPLHMSNSSCYLPYLAVELLEHIAYYSASPLGPPSSILALQLTCKSINNALLFNRERPYLYDRIFRLKFDVQAPRRRLGHGILHPSTLAEELRRRCTLLQRIRNCAVTSPSVRDDLWLAYLMLLESDGRNERQLIEWGGLRDYAMAYLVQSLGRDRDSYGWPIESEENALAVWLLWMSSDEDSIRREPAEIQSLVLRILQPFIIAPFKYQAAFVPDTHFTLPLVGSPASNPPRCITTPHGQFPVYRDPIPFLQPTVKHFGQSFTITAPPLTPAALLCIHSRRQLGYMQPPDGLLPYRSDLGPGEVGLTLEDYSEVNERVKTWCIRHALSDGTHDSPPSFVEDLNSNVGEEQMALDTFEALLSPTNSQYSRNGQSDLSWQHEHDWLRITHCYNPWLDATIKIRIFTPGMLHGLWAGRMFAYDATEYSQLAQKHQAPDALFDKGAENYPLAYQRPFYMRIREHHCLSEYLPIGWGQGVYDRESDGLSNAYFPPGTEFTESRTAGQVRVYDPNTEEFLFYETYQPNRLNSHAASGGCKHCRPRSTSVPANDPENVMCSSFVQSDCAGTFPVLTPEQRKEAERIFSDEEHEDVWEDRFENGCINDIIITGETDYEHGRAWDSYRWYGRVRDSDGFIILLRFPEEPNTRGAGTYIFRGYIHSNLNFVGRWRAASEAPDAFTAVEGNFSLCKMS